MGQGFGHDQGNQRSSSQRSSSQRSSSQRSSSQRSSKRDQSKAAQLWHQQAQAQLKVGPDLAPYVRSLPAVVAAMLELGQVNEHDYLYDLGCGDGRIVITAAQKYGTRGLGVDSDLDRIQEARQWAENWGLSDRVTFHHQDLLTLDLSPASVVTLYLLPDTHLQLRAKLWEELSPGSRVIAHSFDMGDWSPTRTSHISDVINTYPIYVWEVG